MFTKKKTVFINNNKIFHNKWEYEQNTQANWSKNVNLPHVFIENWFRVNAGAGNWLHVIWIEYQIPKMK